MRCYQTLFYSHILCNSGSSTIPLFHYSLVQIKLGPASANERFCNRPYTASHCSACCNHAQLIWLPCCVVMPTEWIRRSSMRRHGHWLPSNAFRPQNGKPICILTAIVVAMVMSSVPIVAATVGDLEIRSNDTGSAPSVRTEHVACRARVDRMRTRG